MCILSTTLLKLSTPDLPIPVPLQTLIKSRFQAKPATLLILVDLCFFPMVEEFHSTGYQTSSFSLLLWGVVSTACTISFSCTGRIGASSLSQKEPSPVLEVSEGAGGSLALQIAIIISALWRCVKREEHPSSFSSPWSFLFSMQCVPHHESNYPKLLSC
jgi:hypothetical protein